MPTLLGSVGSAQSVGAVASLSFSQAVAAGSNRCMAVGVSGLGTTTTPITFTVTWNAGSAFTKVGDANITTANYGFAEIHRGLDPLLPVTTANVAIVPSRSCILRGGASVWTDVDQGTPFGPFVASGISAVSATSISVTVPTNVGQTVLDVVTMYEDPTYTITPSDTNLWNFGATADMGGGQQYGLATGASKTLTWTISAADDQAWQGAAVLNPVTVPVIRLPLRHAPSAMRTGRGGLLMRRFAPSIKPDLGVVSTTGTAAITQAADTTSATGAVLVSGTAADTQAANTSAVVAANAITGTAADTQAANTTAGAAKNLVSGTGADTQGLNTTAGAGTVLVSGTAADTQAQNTTAGTGANATSGTASDTQGANSTSGAAASLVSGSAADTQALNSTSAAGANLISGTAADTQQPNTTDGEGTVADSGASTGTAAITQAANVSSGSGAVDITGAGASSTGNTSEGVAQTDAATGGAGEYETKRKKRYVTKIGNQLVVIPDPSVLDLLHEETPEQIKVPVKEIKAKAKVYNLDKEMSALLKAEEYAEALKVYEDLQDEEDIEMLLLAL